MPAIIFDRLPEDHVVQMFVTINAKHTRLNASHLVSLSGRQLYRDENLAAAHDVVRALNDREDSPLYGEIKLLGVGGGRVAQAPLAQELKKLFAAEAFGPGRKGEAFREESKKFFVNYLKQVAQVFGAAWNGRKYSIKSANALRAFIRVAPDVVRRLDQEHADRTDFRAIGRVIAPWGRRIGDLRFETEGAWKRGGDDGRLAVEGTPAGAADTPKARRSSDRRDWRLSGRGQGGQRRPQSTASVTERGEGAPRVERARGPGEARRVCEAPEERYPPDKKRGTVFSGAPANLQTTRLPSNSRLPAVNIQAVCTTTIEQGTYRCFS